MSYLPLKNYQETALNIYQTNLFDYNNQGSSSYNIQKPGISYSGQKVDYSVM